MFSIEQQEEENLKKSLDSDKPLHTRQMFF